MNTCWSGEHPVAYHHSRFGRRGMLPSVINKKYPEMSKTIDNNLILWYTLHKEAKASYQKNGGTV